MSNAKFAAAKELIQEKKYNEARAILKTINDPKATKWLNQLDKIAPAQVAPPTQYRSERIEADEFYQAQNKKRRRRKLGNGIEMMIAGIFATGLGIAMSMPSIGGVPQQGSSLNGILFLAGIAAFILGLITVLRRNHV